MVVRLMPRLELRLVVVLLLIRLLCLLERVLSRKVRLRVLKVFLVAVHFWACRKLNIQEVWL